MTNKRVQCIEACSSIEARACGIAKITSCLKEETASILSKYCFTLIFNFLNFFMSLKIFENRFKNPGTVITRRETFFLAKTVTYRQRYWQTRHDLIKTENTGIDLLKLFDLTEILKTMLSKRLRLSNECLFTG